MIAVLLKSLLHHPHTAERHDCALKRFFGLKSYNDLQILVDISCRMRCDTGDDLGIGIQHASRGIALFLQQNAEFLPQLFGPLCRTCQE